MAFATLLTLLDDVASMLDDVALMTKSPARPPNANCRLWWRWRRARWSIS